MPSDRTTALLAALLTGAVASGVAALDPAHGVGPDGAAYLRAAHHLAHGGGLVQPAATASGEARFAVWPIGYPALVAGPVALGVPLLVASKLVGVASWLGIAVALTRALPGRATVAVLLLASGSALRTVAHTASEGPFVAGMVALAAAVGGAARPAARVAAGLCAVALFLLRYLGLFAVGVLLGAAALAWRGGRRDEARGLALAAAPAAAVAGLYLMANQTATGHATGMARLPAPEGAPTLLLSLARATVAELVPPVALISSRPDHAAALAVSAIATLVAARWAWRDLRVAPSSPLAGAAAGVGAAYLVAVIGLRLVSHFDLFGWRLLHPGVALLTIAAVARLEPTPGLRRAAALLAGAACVVQLGLAASDARRAPPPEPAAWRALPPGCVVGPHPVELGWQRPDLVPAEPAFTPYHATQEPVRAFAARLAALPQPCVRLEVRDLRPDRYDPSWAALAARHPVGTLLDPRAVPIDELPASP